MPSMKMLFIAAALAGVDASTGVYEQCKQPVLEWIGIDQGEGVSGGRHNGFAVATKGDDIYMGSYSIGNMSYTAPTDQRMDITAGPLESHLFVIKTNAAGVAQWIMEMDYKWGECTSVGPHYCTSAAGVYDIAPFPNSDHIAVSGNFVGNLTFAMEGGGTKMISNDVPNPIPSSAGRFNAGSHNAYYNTWVAKVNSLTGKVVWVEKIGASSPAIRRSMNFGASTVDPDGNVLVAGEGNLGSPPEGYLAKLAGLDGSVVFDKAWVGIDDIYGVAADATGIYFAGELIGNNRMIDQLGPYTSYDEGTEESAIAVKIDATNQEALWVTPIGKGSTHYVVASPTSDYVYVVGRIEAPSTFPSGASLDASEGGFLVKLSTTDGAASWAVDVPSECARGALSVSNDGLYVHLAATFDGTLPIGTSFSLSSVDDSSDIMVAKLRASDGHGQWALSLGGTGRERVYGMAETPDGGVALVGYTESSTIKLGDSTLTIDNNVAGGLVTRGTAVMLVKIDGDEVVPTCLTSCAMNSDDKTSTRVVADGHCFVHNRCYEANDPSPSAPCFKCVPTESIDSFSGPFTTDYCYINVLVPSYRSSRPPSYSTRCVAAGTHTPAYRNRNLPSVCEICDPIRAPTDWSLINDNWAVDHEFAKTQETDRMGGRGSSGVQENKYGMSFPISSNGCQPVPNVPIQSPPGDIVSTAIVESQLSSTNERMIQTYQAVSYVTAKESFAAASVYWGKHSPFNAPFTEADELGMAFGTHFSYGTAVSNIEIQQALALGNSQRDVTEPTTQCPIEVVSTWVCRNHQMARTQANVLLTIMQKVMRLAYWVDTAQSAELRTAYHKAMAELLAHLMDTALSDAVGHAMEEVKKFASVPHAVDDNGNYYCKVKKLFESHLPSDAVGPFPNTISATNLGTLQAAAAVVCADDVSPSPPPPSPTPSPPPPSPKASPPSKKPPSASDVSPASPTPAPTPTPATSDDDVKPATIVALVFGIGGFALGALALVKAVMGPPKKMVQREISFPRANDGGLDPNVVKASKTLTTATSDVRSFESKA